MTTAEALNQIPEIVSKAIPLTGITCPVKLENAKWRREELERKIKTLIIRHESGGLNMSIDLDEIIKTKGNEEY